MTQTSHKRLLYLASALAFSIMVVLETGAFHQRVGPENPVAAAFAPQPADPRSEYTTVRRDAVPIQRRVSATVVPAAAVTVAPRIVGRVLEAGPQVGDMVAAGELMVRLESADLVAAKGVAEASLAGALAREEGASGSLARDRAEATRAQAEWERTRSLHESGTATTRQLDGARAALASARGAVSAAEASVAAAGADRERARKALEGARVALGHTVLRAPLSGVVTERSVEVGDLAQPGEVLFRLNDPGALRLAAFLPADYGSALSRGRQLTFTWSAGDATETVTVTEVQPQAEARSRTVRIETTVPQDSGLLSGQVGSISYTAGQRSSLTIPQSAVRRFGQLESVRLRDAAGLMRTRHVRTIPSALAGRVELLSGLRENDEVFLSGEDGGQR
ncbi:MAG: efflux RND transporter periplasmic adaptor subunit [Planctomycetota bacterium]|jgi:multidrug efflux pump subunit AcrA (membrane-fusion protein)|nr:efflux RND transporter periplasmic adaptor subunit [Planctomycetota bacterium]MDP6838276.1 efflux RND transporter periplasmic adaptor subunit [Planctomycetota bacterium]MDP6956514.1 efflux RND transporter periplasmic adaptor subunit [Planctomycetota bacterium]